MKNLIIRALTGAAFVAALVSCIYLHSISLLLLFCLITGLTIWEFYGLMKRDENSLIKRMLHTLGGIYLFAATFFYTHDWCTGKIFLPYLLFLLGMMVAELYYKAPNPINNWAFTFFAQIYCAGSFSLLNFMAVTPDGKHAPILILAIFIFVWLNDTGAYLTGVTCGRKRLFERISPKKSWEGFWGGVIVATASSQIFAHLFPEIAWYNWLGLSATVVVFATWGDLVESLLKRTLEVKDSGHLLPGHGGMLDRFDSILLAAPAAYIYIESFIRN